MKRDALKKNVTSGDGVFRYLLLCPFQTAVALLSAGAKDPLFAIYGVSCIVGGLSGSIVYFSVLLSHERKTKQRTITWLPLIMVIAALVGFLWWLLNAIKL